MRHRFATRVRLHHHDSAPAYLPLALFRGIAGIAFLCFGELFWMHLSRIGLKDEAQVLGSIPLILGSVMAVGALCGAAGHSFSADEGGRLPRLGAVYLCAPVSLADLLGAIIFTIKRSETFGRTACREDMAHTRSAPERPVGFCGREPRERTIGPGSGRRYHVASRVLRLDLQHEETHAGGGGRPHPRGTDTIVPGSPEDTPQSRAESFRKLYDTFLFLALACSMLEAVVFRFGRRHIIGAEQRRRYRRSGWGGADVGLGGGGMVSINGLESLLDEEDVRESARGWEDWRGETVQQRLLMEQRYEQLRRSSLEKSEGLLEHIRGGKNSL